MSYDLIPKNKEVSRLSLGWPFWNYLLLDAGIGLVIGAGNSIRPSQYRYIPDKRGASPLSNDGYYVNKKNAKLMSVVAKGWVDVERGKRIEWEELNEEQQKQMKKWNDRFKTYKFPASKEFIDNILAFADFAEKSNGFSIR